MCFLSFIRQVNYGIRKGFPEKEHHHQPRDLLPGRIDKRFLENAHLIDEDKDKQFVCRSCREVNGKKVEHNSTVHFVRSDYTHVVSDGTMILKV